MISHSNQITASEVIDEIKRPRRFIYTEVQLNFTIISVNLLGRFYILLKRRYTWKGLNSLLKAGKQIKRQE
jgi:hypothetical protein